MSVEEIKRKFVEHVKLRGYDDKFIDAAEERKILEYGIQQGISLDQGRALVAQVAIEQGYAVESVAEMKAKEVLEQFASDGQVDKKEFDDAVAIISRTMRGNLSDDACRKKVKEIMLKQGWKAREGFMKGGSWFSSI